MNLEQTLPLAATWGMHGGWWIVMMIPMVLFWAAIVLGIAWFVKGATRGGWTSEERHAGTETPADILDRRFAEGGITYDDYRARRAVLADGAAEPNRASEDELLTAPGAAEGRH